MVALIAALIAVGGAFLRDMHRAYARIRSGSTVFSSPRGDIEFAQAHSGPAVLVVHGSGGGFDQGELVAQTVLDEHFHWIAPSRFGYLRSVMPAEASWDEQAHAYAHLLDHLRIKRVAVVALSQGGPSALLSAALHPERVSSLTCLSCGVAPSAGERRRDADRNGELLKATFQSDLRYWLLSRFARRSFLRALGASPAVVASMSREQRDIVDRLVDEMNPASLRTAGVNFDNRAPLPGERIASITAPTLIVHARDDTLQLFDNAEFAATRIQGARRLTFERGGHLVLAVELDAIRAAVCEHIRAHAATPPRS